MSAKRILVVDDDPLVCESVRMILETDGHEVETALSGKAAMDLFQKKKFDLTFVDYQMPDMNGDELAGAIKALDPDHPVAMITAYPETLAASRAPLAGVNVVICKPFDLAEVRNAIAKLSPKPRAGVKD